MNTDNHEELNAEPAKIARYLRGKLNHDEYVSLEVREILEELPLYTARITSDKEEYEFKGLNFDDPNHGSLIDASIRLMHRELQTVLLEETRQVRIDNPNAFDNRDGRIRVHDKEIPFNQKCSYKISYLTEEYFRVKTGTSAYKYSDLRHHFGDQFTDKSNIYKACLAVHPSSQAQRKINYYKTAYLSDNDPRYFETKRDVAVFFRALQLSRYLFKFAGQYIETRANVLQIFRNEHYYLDPCIRCDNPRIVESYIKSEFDKYSDSSDGPGKKAYSIMSDLARIVESDTQATLLPDELVYHDLKISHP
jgi:hypothetical protein